MAALTVERHGRVAVCTISRPEKNNAWGPDLEVQLFKSLSNLDADTSVHAAIITGSGDYFCTDASDPDAAGARGQKGNYRIKTLQDIKTMRLPVICVINGVCSGMGLCLAVACDVRYIAASAKVSAGFAMQGRLAEQGLSYMLPHLVGTGGAAMLLLTNEAMGPEELPNGFVQKVFPKMTVMDEAVTWATKISTFGSPTSMSIIKAQVYHHPFLEDVDEAQGIAQSIMSWNVGGPDNAEGNRTFGSGIAPNFMPFNCQQPYMMLAKELIGTNYDAYKDIPDLPREAVASTLVSIYGPGVKEGKGRAKLNKGQENAVAEQAAPSGEAGYPTQAVPPKPPAAVVPEVVAATQQEASLDIKTEEAADSHTPLTPIADGIWEATYYDPSEDSTLVSQMEKACKAKGELQEAQGLLDKAKKRYGAGELPPCVYKERMIVFEMPKDGGVCIYNAVPLTSHYQMFCQRMGGVKLIVVPSSQHVQFHRQWVEAFPNAVVICPGGPSMQAAIHELGRAAHVLDSKEPNKWDKVAIKMLIGITAEVLDVNDFQEIVIMHRKSKTLIMCDSLYIASVDKSDASAWPSFSAEEWSEIFVKVYIENSESHLPAYRSVLPDKKQIVAAMLKKMVNWKPERLAGVRCSKVTTGGWQEAKDILQAHWAWCVEVAQPKKKKAEAEEDAEAAEAA